MDEQENTEVTEEVVAEEPKKKKRQSKYEEQVVEEALPTPPVPPSIPEHIFQYKIDMYTPRGMLKAHISRPVFADMSRKYGDIMRAIYINRWITLDDIISNYCVLDKRFRFDRKRTNDSIRAAVEEMVNAGLIQKR